MRALVAALMVAAAAVAPAEAAAAEGIRDRQWHLHSLDVAEAHQHSEGEGVIVAVIDSGVSPHPDLRGNLLRGVDIVHGGDGRGQRDQSGHGTAMAGIIAANGRNGGALGIAPKAKVLPVFASPPADDGRSTDIGIGVEWAIANGARIINISSGGSSAPRLRLAIEDAIAKDIVVVAAAGNSPGPDYVDYPAAYPGVVAVSGVDRRGRHAKISVSGQEVAIAAPSDDIWTTSKGNDYETGDGTSNSAAIVSGAAALIRSRYPDLTAEEVIHRLTATATDKGPPGHDPEYGHGIVNLVAALTADVPPLPQPTPTINPTKITSTPTAQAIDRDGAGLPWGTIGCGILTAIAATILGTAWHRSRRRTY
ncbi:type VII secretion-associated serine protease mycosin [Micromonosporaceae bacterium DT194]|uniref:type VII secretion-associated serine protease mycosin n=1 Tax=Melissospora conviva TaxID=3388432 RepID=UPI003C226FAD